MLDARRIPVAVALTMTLILTLTSIALAHSEFVSAVPAPGSTVAAAPSGVRATYTEEINPKGAAITITDSRGARADRGDGHVDLTNAARNTMLVSLRSGLGPGKYTVNWTTLALDGDSLSGSFSFTVEVSVPTLSAAGPVVAAASTLPSAGGWPIALFPVVGIALASGGGALRRRGR